MNAPSLGRLLGRRHPASCPHRRSGPRPRGWTVSIIGIRYRIAIQPRRGSQVLPGLCARPPNNGLPEMEVSFSRGFSHGWLKGCDHKALVPATGLAKQGIYLGVVQEVRGAGKGGQAPFCLRSTAGRSGKGGLSPFPPRLVVELAGAAKRGRRHRPGREPRGDTPTRGAGCTKCFAPCSLTEPVASGVVELTFGRGVLDWNAIHPGQKIWKTDDPELSRRLRKSFKRFHAAAPRGVGYSSYRGRGRTAGDRGPGRKRGPLPAAIGRVVGASRRASAIGRNPPRATGTIGPNRVRLAEPGGPHQWHADDSAKRAGASAARNGAAAGRGGAWPPPCAVPPCRCAAPAGAPKSIDRRRASKPRCNCTSCAATWSRFRWCWTAASTA